AIDLLCQRLGVDEQAAVAFGDSGNDLSMTGRACTFVAVANGTEQVRDAADEVCPSIGDDGVAQWLEARLA
ncbi:MAG: HAD hydrolase family protein, partial [Atopobiaceae bacterium]|nr:HAD hydrolase family protein [Atopobiaceae bacterium]